ncbi:AMIN-like domain-containing (lipo)protein [Promicromonospora iranensis]|uniref:AMIN-like domain-containing (lipo)protein n=1 Tax=Promicromonospora iranensis TaxID=1105144 RepID=UPI0023A98A4C|nr:hypothetical protein [Promicromonospora iranensis]
MGRAGQRTASTAAAFAAAALLAAGCTSGPADSEEPGDGASSPAPIASSPADPSPSDTGPDDGGSDDGTDGTPEPAASATEAASGPPFPANTRPDTAEPTGEGETFLSVTDVRVAGHDRYDRVVFDLDGKGSGQPGWRVEYVDQATDDGSGHAVEVDGDAILRVSLSGTAIPTDSGVKGFTGERIEPEDTDSVDEIVYRYWFEGYTTAFLGVDEGERPFRVFLLENPTRVVVDVQH